jgi:hypothetical protein
MDGMGYTYNGIGTRRHSIEVIQQDLEDWDSRFSFLDKCSRIALFRDHTRVAAPSQSY